MGRQFQVIIPEVIYVCACICDWVCACECVWIHTSNTKWIQQFLFIYVHLYIFAIINKKMPLISERMNGAVHARVWRKERREWCNYTLINIFNKNKCIFYCKIEKEWRAWLGVGREPTLPFRLLFILNFSKLSNVIASSTPSSHPCLSRNSIAYSPSDLFSNLFPYFQPG